MHNYCRHEDAILVATKKKQQKKIVQLNQKNRASRKAKKDGLWGTLSLY